MVWVRSLVGRAHLAPGTQTLCQGRLMPFGLQATFTDWDRQVWKGASKGKFVDGGRPCWFNLVQRLQDGGVRASEGRSGGGLEDGQGGGGGDDRDGGGQDCCGNWWMASCGGGGWT